ncbi:hypothetical protein B0H11DRAFT_1931140 [Mycena galericulata]|nr:hypothetical protein B0H11DRAFT_1931140 [Mycena galericulata]
MGRVSHEYSHGSTRPDPRVTRTRDEPYNPVFGTVTFGVGGGGIGHVKIADFGLSKVIKDREETMTICGTINGLYGSGNRQTGTIQHGRGCVGTWMHIVHDKQISENIILCMGWPRQPFGAEIVSSDPICQENTPLDYFVKVGPNLVKFSFLGLKASTSYFVEIIAPDLSSQDPRSSAQPANHRAKEALPQIPTNKPPQYVYRRVWLQT